MKASRAETTLSRLGAARGPLLLAAALVLLSGCTSTKGEEVRKLQARATYEQAVRNLTENRLALGMAALKEALQLDPDNAQYHNTLGPAQVEQDQPERVDDAIAAYKKALTF